MWLGRKCLLRLEWLWGPGKSLPKTSVFIRVNPWLKKMAEGFTAILATDFHGLNADFGRAWIGGVWYNYPTGVRSIHHFGKTAIAENKLVETEKSLFLWEIFNNFNFTDWTLPLTHGQSVESVSEMER